MVELRTRTHLHSPLHSIRAIKNGSIKTVVNKDARGKSKLKFRLLVDIYNQGNTKDGDESIPRVVRDLDNVSTQGSCMFGGESNIETVPDGFDMTLEKIRKQCREKKRKLGIRGDTKTAASQVKGEGCDLEEPLSNWNTKFSKRSKKKQARVTNSGGSTSSPSAIKVDLPVFCDVKPEAMDCNKEGESTTSAESVEEIMHEFKETILVLYRRPEPITSGMVAVEEPLTPTPVDEVFEDASEEFDDGGCLADNIDLENQANVLYSSVSREEIEMEVPQSSESETIAEGCVLEEPLSNWNTKFSKKRKRKQVDLPAFCDVKPEAAWDDSYSVSEAMDFIPTESTTSTELVEEIMHELSKATRLVLYPSPEPVSSVMVAIEEPITTKPVDEAFKDVSEEFNDARRPQGCLADVLYSSVSREEIELEVPQSSESETIDCVKNLIYSNPSSESEEANEDEQSNGSKPKLDMIITGLEIVKTEAPEIIATDSSVFEVENTEIVWETEDIAKDHLPEAIEESISTKPMDKALVVSREEIELEVPQSSDSETIGSVKNLIYSSKSSESEEAKEDEQSNYTKPKLDLTITGLEIVKIEAPEILAMPITGLEIVKIEAPEVLTTGSSDFVVENVKIVLETESIVKDELPEAIDIIQLTNCCNSLANLHLVPVDSTIPLEEDQQPQLYKEPEEVTTGTETKSIEQQQLHYQPGKLLSGRKALSPTSQAKLRKAMEQPDSPEKRSKKSKGKLYFSSQNSHRILKAQGLDSIDLVEVVPNSKRSIQKANNNNPQQRQYQRATHKFSRRAGKRQPFSTGCTSIQGCTQKAIAFSQGQVRDFQFVATRLTKELKSMREITKRCLLAETNTSNMPESNLDEVKTLVKNAEKVEKSSEKWLSIIERDCNRFCKLMGMVKEDTLVTENIVQKEKKIKFADDAGGDLCQVKVFEIDLEPES